MDETFFFVISGLVFFVVEGLDLIMFSWYDACDIVKKMMATVMMSNMCSLLFLGIGCCSIFLFGGR